jgi:hypothetical protein
MGRALPNGGRTAIFGGSCSPGNRAGCLGPRAKDFFRWRKYACEDVGTNKGAGVADDDQSSLITALKGRDRSAWNAAVDRHLHEVYGFVFHLVGRDRAVAEDLNQETWLEALDGIDQCDADRGTFRNWLFGIARKRVALHYRRRALETEKGTVPICAKHPEGRSGKWGLSPFSCRGHGNEEG